MMTRKEFITELGKIPARRLNQIMYAFDCNVPKEEIGLKGEVEEMFYEDMAREAAEYERKYGVRPVSEMMEIEYDDPVLDIYNTPV